MLYTILWIGWLVAFVIIEGSAIITKKYQNTLSEKTWKWFGVFGPWTWKRYVLAAFLVWLLGHLAFGWWAG